MVEFDIIGVCREFYIWKGVKKVIDEYEEKDRSDAGALKDAEDYWFRI